MGEIEIKGYICERCKHVWRARNKEKPKVCPLCKSAYWDTPRKNKKLRLRGKK